MLLELVIFGASIGAGAGLALGYVQARIAAKRERTRLMALAAVAALAYLRFSK